jgi:hypothetical protein
MFQDAPVMTSSSISPVRRFRNRIVTTLRPSVSSAKARMSSPGLTCQLEE